MNMRRNQMKPIKKHGSGSHQVGAQCETAVSFTQISELRASEVIDFLIKAGPSSEYELNDSLGPNYIISVYFTSASSYERRYRDAKSEMSKLYVRCHCLKKSSLFHIFGSRYPYIALICRFIYL